MGGEKMQDTLSIVEKLRILSDAAKYDVACTSSGSSRSGKKGSIGNTVAGGICHCFSQDGRCISLLKILFTNECIYDCKYCINRKSNDVKRVSFTPEEVAQLTIDFYKRNYIEGLFLSSGILHNPTYTMEQLYETLYLLRNQYHFNGYIHVKAIPGADPVLIEQIGYLADRMSVNLELPTAEGLKALAPNKNRNTILKPMKQIQLGRRARRLELEDMRNRRTVIGNISDRQVPVIGKKELPAILKEKKEFVPAGQSSQMIIGATPESDYQIIKVAEALYQKFDLKRVFYSAFVNTTMDSALPVLESGPPLLREHRLYQADWLLRFYGFQADEILSEKNPNFNILLDPKCNWAIQHLEHFPVEINRASYNTLLRVPGIGVKSARRIVQARKSVKLDFQDIKKLGVVLKRAIYFITCQGRMMYPVKVEEAYILNHMLEIKEKLPAGVKGSELYQQLSLFGCDTDSGFQIANGN